LKPVLGFESKENKGEEEKYQESHKKNKLAFTPWPVYI
jgi:hypothetical protein